MSRTNDTVGAMNDTLPRTKKKAFADEILFDKGVKKID